MNAPTPDIATVLVEAASILTDEGWIQRNFRDSTGAHCAYDALDQANSRLLGDRLIIPAYEPFREFVVGPAKPLRFQRLTLSSWNDAPGRTADEVISTFLAAAEQLGGVAR